jgi:hypothetical protein
MVPFVHLDPTIFVLPVAEVQLEHIRERNLYAIEMQARVTKLFEQRESGQRSKEDVKILVAVSAAAIQSGKK